jgi:hypothetical protein
MKLNKMNSFYREKFNRIIKFLKIEKSIKIKYVNINQHKAQ